MQPGKHAQESAIKITTEQGEQGISCPPPPSSNTQLGIQLPKGIKLDLEEFQSTLSVTSLVVIPTTAL